MKASDGGTQTPYRISVYRAAQADQAEVYRLSLRSRLPAIKIPLRPTDADVVLDLQPLLGPLLRERSLRAGYR